MHASAKVCRKCQKMKLIIQTQISNNKENENAVVSSDYEMNNNIKDHTKGQQQNSKTKDNIMKIFFEACEDLVEITLNQENNCARD